MIVFREPKRVVNPSCLKNEANPLAFLIQLGEIESALVEKTKWPPEPLREATLQAARAVLSGSPLPQVELPDGPLEVSVPEGYAYYALDPMTYVESAERFQAECHPERVVCIGIRSIGTSLSALVAAALERTGVSVRSITVRPEGHPFDRVLELEPALKAELRNEANSWFAVVDEGPGLSGSTFAAVAGKLTGLGIPHHKVVLFPSWDTDGSGFVSQNARSIWQRHRRYTAEPVFDPGWQPYVPPVRASSPQHEARQVLWKAASF